VAFKIRSASAFKFKTDSLDAADRAWVDCSGAKRRKRKVAALGGMKMPKRA
jgi:hypothetical protein